MFLALYEATKHTTCTLYQAQQQALQEKITAATNTNKVQLIAIHACCLIAGDERIISKLLPSIIPCTLYRLDSLPFAHSYIALPRRGTTSAWSSNALDILFVAQNLEEGAKQAVHAIEEGRIYQFSTPLNQPSTTLSKLLHDSMTEQLVELSEIANWFNSQARRVDPIIDVQAGGMYSLTQFNQNFQLALSNEEQQILLNYYVTNERNPTAAELMTFAQTNSEHCRHKIFNAQWSINDRIQQQSLFDYIKHTHKTHPNRVVSAYKDNAAAMEGFTIHHMSRDKNDAYQLIAQKRHLLLKVETHNHPTAISPYQGAATGVGGEIRDEVATGIGGASLCGFAGYAVSGSDVFEDTPYPSQSFSYPAHIADACRIMLEAPIGASRFNNEFGRPNLIGFFRSFSYYHQGITYGYHKPIMIAGGIGHINAAHVHKKSLTNGDVIVLIGGPALRIGIGGGTSSSITSDDTHQAIDFASVQRANPEMQRRAQEVIERATNLEEDNPIVFMHDVGAGGIANAIAELLSDTTSGSIIELGRVPVGDSTLSPMEIWCNESQERYVLVIRQSARQLFFDLCASESCPIAELGKINTKSDRLIVRHTTNNATSPSVIVDIPLSLLFNSITPLKKSITTTASSKLLSTDESLSVIEYGTAYSDDEQLDVLIKATLMHPTVASKQFLITICDRSVGGMTIGEQMVGTKQVPVADAAVVAASFVALHGYAFSTAERSPVALISAEQSVRLTIAEVFTNLASVAFKIEDCMLSANWMAACDVDSQSSMLHAGVAAASRFCAALGVPIPVGKDSLSMQMRWQEKTTTKSILSPLSLVASATARIADIRQRVTPELSPNAEHALWLLDLSATELQLGGSIYAQIHKKIGTRAPDIMPNILHAFLRAMYDIHLQNNMLLAYHDRSDGGLLASLCEMAFCSHCGLLVQLTDYLKRYKTDQKTALWNEAPGVILQINAEATDNFFAILRQYNLADRCQKIAQPTDTHDLQIFTSGILLYTNAIDTLHAHWHEASFRLQVLRDVSEYAVQEKHILTKRNRYLRESLTFTPHHLPRLRSKKPTVAILRERGTNGQKEMAYAFMKAGFKAVDVSMRCLLTGKQRLDTFDALAACGGFAHGDVFGAARGWASGILHNQALKTAFSDFFAREDSIAFAVCNGCQLFSLLHQLLPNTTTFPNFLPNTSQRYESRLVNVVIQDSPSIAFRNMAGSQLVVPVAHAEGRATQDTKNSYITLRYTTYDGQKSNIYPINPNGSVEGIAGITSKDGRITIMMPHPERVVLRTRETWRCAALQRSYEASEESAWMQIFHNMYAWCTKR